MIDWLIKLRIPIALATCVALGLLVAFGKPVRYEQSLTSFFSERDPLVVEYERTAGVFGSDNIVFVGYDDPELLTPAGMARVAELSSALAPERIEAITSVNSLASSPQYWRVDDQLVRLVGMPGFLQRPALAALRGLMSGRGSALQESLSVRAAIDQADEGELPALAATVRSHPLLRGSLVSADGKATVIVTQLRSMGEQDVRATIAAIRDAADTFAARHGLSRPAVVGPPVLLADGFTAIERDGRILSRVGMALIALVMLGATRSLWWALVPMVCGWTIWLATATILASLDLRLSLSGGPLVAQIIVLTMPAASHLAIHFRDDLRRMRSRHAAARETLESVSMPVLWCGLTGMLGYAALLSSTVVPVRQFGAILGGCTLATALLTLAVAPAAMIPPRRRRLEPTPPPPSRSASAVDRLTHLVARFPIPVIVVTLAVLVLLAPGTFRLRYESNYINVFKPTARVLHDYQFIESRIGGIGLVSLVVPASPPLDTKTLDRFRQLERGILERWGTAAAQGQGRVTQVLSLATILDPEGRLAALPAAQREQAIATKLDLIAASPQGALLDQFWAPKAGRARLFIRLPEQQPAAAKMAIFGDAQDQATALLGSSSVTGLSLLLTQTTRGVMATSWTTFLWALGLILAMLLIAFRSVWLALLAIAPSVIAVAVVLGLMGWLGVKLDLATALVASVALGLSVDDTFHCLLQFQRQRRATGAFWPALYASYSVSGPGVLLSSVAVALGFSVLWFSEFVPFSNFGMLVAVATMGSTLGNLIFLPACLSLAHRVRGGDRAGAGDGPPQAVPEAPGPESPAGSPVA